MRSDALDRLRRDGEALMSDISRELYRAHAGLQSRAELTAIYARYGAILDRETLALAREAFMTSTAGTDEHRLTRLLLDWQVETQGSRQLADLDEREIAWEATAVVRMADGGVLGYQRAAIDLANASTRAERLAIDDARASLVGRELVPMRRERFAREHDFVASLELAPSYNATWEVLSGIDLGNLAGACQRFLTDTQAAWDDVFPAEVKRGLGIAPEEATRADGLALFRGREFDRYFPAADLERSLRRQMGELGIDLIAGGRIVLDTAERESKRARAFCAPVRVPDEVYLVLRPHGGRGDWSTFLHELGHALHFAYTRPDEPFEARWLGDNSVTEGYAMLFDHLMHDRRWLARYTTLGRAAVPAFLRSVGFEELHLIRRYAAKLLYERELHAGLPLDSAPDAYVELLRRATGFRYQASDALVDVDPRFYAARYLRAWQLQASLADMLATRFDEDWWRNPAAGPWIVEQLFGPGQHELADDLALRAGGPPLSFAPVVRRIEALLSA